ncbi:MAG: response regulator transcription factor [Spirochaetota bacterium]
MSQTKIKIYIVEDHPLLIQGISTLINQQTDMEVCGNSSTINDAYTGIVAQKPGAVILDISLKNNENGLNLLKKLKVEYPDLPVLVLSMYDEPIYVERSLQMGAMGYVTKKEAAAVIISAIHKILKREIFLNPDVATKLIGKLYNTSPEPSALSVELLTNRELEIFEMIGKGLATKDIAGSLGLKISTVETHRTHIKDKLQIQNNNELIRVAVQWSMNAT